MPKPILCIDFDGVIHSYECGWQDGAIYGTATPGFFRWAAEAMKVFDLVIYSSRSKTEEGRAAMREAIGKWSVDAVHNGEVGGDFDWGGFFPHLQFSEVKPPAFLTIDDRAVCFTGDWDGLSPADLLAFQPWTVRGPREDREVPDYAGMLPGDMLAAVGTDGMAWADAFMQVACMANPLGRELRAFPHGDRAPLHGTMLGWFCNAIEAGRAAGEQAMRRRLYPLFDQAVICEPIVGETHLTIRYESTRDAHAAHAALVDLAREVGILGKSVDTEADAREQMADGFAADFDAIVREVEASPEMQALFAQGAAGSTSPFAEQAEPTPGEPRPAEGWRDGVRVIPDARKAVEIARAFIDKHHVSCPEASVNDGVYEEAPLLVEQLAEAVGYYRHPEEA